MEKKIGWVRDDLATTDGTAIYLPAVVNHFDTEEENFAWYKLISSHQAGHVEFGSFGFDLDRPSTKYKDIRPRLAPVAPARLAAMADDRGRAGIESGRVKTSAGDHNAWALRRDFSRFFALFPDSQLARDIFAVAEDTRIDRRLVHEYPGLAPLLSVAQSRCLSRRPHIAELPAREALVEFMVRLSLHAKGDVPVPEKHLDIALKTRRLMDQLSDPTATVEDAAEVTIRIYGLLSAVPNRDTAFPGLHATHGRAYRSVGGVDYRGAFKPELAQVLSRGAVGRGESRGPERPRAISRQHVEALVRTSSEVEQPPSQMPEDLRWRELADSVARELAERDPSAQFSPSSLQDDDAGAALEATQAGTFTYDEWDCDLREYKANWCLLREKRMTGSETGFFEQTLATYAKLARQIRRHFELATPEIYRKVKHLQDGEEHDLDDVIEAVIDHRIGKTPSEKLYWRRNKVERSVAVVLLLDMSASTGDAIEPMREGSPGGRKRIVDVEKEAIVLLLNALSVLGDSAGVYGFSGYSRRNVEFYVIKDFQEDVTPQVARRIGWISPQYTTRMGAAIRHATAKLLQQQARSRFLLMLSDGRPQDLGYSSAGEYRQYAVQDTRVALLEARRRGIIPFCLTVDQAGHSYLRIIMHEMHYEVLSDVSMLPVRLPQLYRQLTT